MQKLHILLLALGLVASAHGSESPTTSRRASEDEFVSSFKLRVARVAHELRQAQQLQLFITAAQQEAWNVEINDCFVAAPASPTKEERQELFEATVAVNKQLTALLKAQGPARIAPTVTVSEA